jgi:hypothetical protein
VHKFNGLLNGLGGLSGARCAGPLAPFQDSKIGRPRSGAASRLRLFFGGAQDFRDCTC